VIAVDPERPVIHTRRLTFRRREADVDFKLT